MLRETSLTYSLFCRKYPYNVVTHNLAKQTNNNYVNIKNIYCVSFNPVTTESSKKKSLAPIRVLAIDVRMHVNGGMRVHEGLARENNYFDPTSTLCLE